jgi:hypothetical protein
LSQNVRMTAANFAKIDLFAPYRKYNLWQVLLFEIILN